MFNSLILEVAIGLIFVYFFLSIISSTVNEWISRLLSWRPKMLYDGILNLLSGGVPKDQFSKNLLDKIYKHPLFLGAKPPKDKKEKKEEKNEHYFPSYIPGRSFALALLETLKGDKVSTFDEAKAAVEQIELKDHLLKKALLPLMESAEENLDKALKNIETWYDEAMDRITGWYKRKSQTWIFFLALGLSLALNADTFMMAKSFYSDPALRAAVIATSTKIAEKDMPTDPEKRAKWEENILKTTETLNLPLGWGWQSDQSKKTPPAPASGKSKDVTPAPASSGQSKDITPAPGSKSSTEDTQSYGRPGFSLISKLFGILITALAVSLGAPFWFDLLNKVVNLRSTGKPPKGTQGGAPQPSAQTQSQGSGQPPAQGPAQKPT